MSLEPGTTLGPYRVVRALDAGGMGQVYEALDTRLERRVAIKTLRPELLQDPQARRRFDREAKSLSALNHPNICMVFDVGHLDGLDFLVMEFIEGQTLASILRERPLEEAAIVRIGAQIADAVAEAHEHGVLHRDIKPQNVMVTVRGIVKVLDFGLARAIEPTRRAESSTATALSGVGSLAGTAAYMSPEQVRGEPLDGRSDIFSLGVLLYGTVAGRSPFEAASSAETLSAILSIEPPPLARVAPTLSEELQRVIRKCLEKDRTRRYQSARDVATDLQNLLHESGAAHPSSRRPTAAQRTGRHRRIWTRAAAAALMVIAGAAGARWGLLDRGGIPQVHSLAILPFKPLGRVEENYVGLGIADAVISRISGTPNVTVRPTSAVQKYTAEAVDGVAAGRQLQVDVVLDGTWQREAGRFRVSVNLLRVETGESLWSERFDVPAGDVFAIQDRVSDQLQSRLRLEVNSAFRTRRQRIGTTNPDAYDAYLRGQYHLGARGYSSTDRRDIDAAISHLERAVALDPGYAEAHARLGFAYAHAAIFIENNAALIERARRATDRAAELRPNFGQVHLNRALILWSWYEGWRIVDSVREYRRAEQLDPGLADIEIGAGYAHLGLFEDWRRVGERAIAQDPTNRWARVVYVNEHFLLNLPEEGLAAQRRLLGDGPDFRYFLYSRRVEQAAPLVEARAAERPGDGWAQAELALLRALQGRQEEARSLVSRALDAAQRNRTYHHVTYLAARTYAVQRNAGETARWLQATIDWGFPCYPVFSTDALLDPVRSSAPVQKVLADLERTWQRYRAALE